MSQHACSNWGMPTADTQPSLITVDEFARVLGVTRARAYELARSGLVPGVVRVGRQIRINPRKLVEFIEAGGRGLESGNCRTPKHINRP